jgi:hypothetical protein
MAYSIPADPLISIVALLILKENFFKSYFDALG